MSLKIPIKPLILVGPSGSGRSAIMLHLTMNFPHKFKKIISHTTRKPRPNEKDNNHFFFIDETKIKQMDANQQLISYTKSPNDHYYGFSKKQVEGVVQSSRIPICKMTLSAYINNVKKMKEHEVDWEALYINVPDMEELRSRLRYSPFSEEEVQKKLETAKREQVQADRYFSEENIIKNDSMDETIVYVKSRLFEIF